ncbi:hypothetical protein A4R43_26640 [Amycolatopsis albispora]|uniref:Carbohydrate kinase n=1 Tax=Amycolatopsis albispora TaxID=1804986 RepID=A0A344LL92_9PSEU|nr:hypothetical protein A4R43_26640 [Amycolatopsis albispora]
MTIGIGIATLGAACVHTIAVDEDGRVRASAVVPLPPPVRDRPGHSEQDPRLWWPAVERALCQVTADLPRGEIGAVAVTATEGTIVPVDRRGLPAGPALLPDDLRGAAFNNRAMEIGGRAEGTPSAALGRVAWLAEHAPQARGIRHGPEVIGTQLTGKRVAVDSGHARGSGYDPRADTWASELHKSLGIPSKWLPEVVPPSTVLGTVSRTSAALTGLPKGCPVVAGMPEDCAAALAAGAVSPGRFAAMLGETYVLKGVSDTPAPDSYRLPGGRWLPGITSNLGSEALRDIARLDAAAAARGPADLVLCRKPFDASETSEFITGEPADEVELHRARLESAAFVERLALDHLRRLRLVPAEPLLTAGPGTKKSLLWTQIRATVSGVRINVAPHAEPAYGAALLAAAGVWPGGLRDHGGSTPVEPVAAERDALLASYHRFCGELHQRGWIDDELHAVTTS